MSATLRTRTPAHVQARHSNVVTSVAFSPDGRSLISGSWDGTIKWWDLGGEKPRLKRTFQGKWDEVEAVAFAPDGRSIAGAGTGFDGAPFGLVMLWTLDSGRGRSLVREDGKIDAIAFAPDGATLAVASGDRRAVLLRDVATGEERAALTDHCAPVWSIAYAPDGRSLAAACGVVPAVARPDGGGPSGEVGLWDLDRREPRLRARLGGHDHGVLAVAFAPDGSRLATGGFDRMVRLWSMDTALESSALAGHEGWVAAVAFAPDGSILATGSHDQTITLWDVAGSRELATLTGHNGSVYAVAFSPDGSRLASGSLDGTVRIWDVDRVLRSRAAAGWGMGRGRQHDKS